MKLSILFLLSIILYSTGLYAVPAYPKPINYQLPDGKTVSITLFGDESNKWAKTEDDFTLVFDSIGNWTFAKVDTNGFAIASEFKLCSNPDRSAELLKMLSISPKNIYPMPIENSILKSANTETRSQIKPTGNYKALVILMSFIDKSFTKQKKDFEELFNSLHYGTDNATGSVRDFFIENSYGQLDLTCDILGPYIARNRMSYYGGNDLRGNDMNPFELFHEAIIAASKDVNLSNYDSNNDGYIDHVHIIFAGYGEEAGANSSAIWSHKMSFPDVYIQNLRINQYSCSPELRNNSGNGITRIGVICHEFGHILGTADFYDTDYSSNGKYPGIGKWDIMASGAWNNDGATPSHFNPYSKAVDFDWSKNSSINNIDSLIIHPSNLYIDQIFRFDTPVNGEFFLIENRKKIGFDSFLPGEGLLVYHVHKDIAGRAATNSINSSHPQMLYLKCASSKALLPNSNPESYGVINSNGCPFPGTSGQSAIGYLTTPSSRCWNGSSSGLEITKIEMNAEGSIMLKLGDKDPDPEYPELPDTTDTNETSIGVLVYGENFEDSPTQKYSILQNSGSLNWQKYVENKEGVSMIDDGLNPKAIEGDSYLFIKSRFSLQEQKSTYITDYIYFEPDSQHILTFFYQNPAFKLNNARFEIRALTNANGESYRLFLSETATDGWVKDSIFLPPLPEICQLAFIGKLFVGGVFLDDIQIFKTSKLQWIEIDDNLYEYETDTGILNNSKFSKSIIKYNTFKSGLIITLKKRECVFIYNLFGRKVFSGTLYEGDNILTLKQGIYIVQSKDYSFKVIIP